MNPLKNTLPLLGQFVKDVPPKLAGALAGKYKIQTRSFSPTSHVVIRTVHAVDSSTIQLVANCMERAKHRRQKAAAKLSCRCRLAKTLNLRYGTEGYFGSFTSSFGKRFFPCRASVRDYLRLKVFNKKIG